MKRRKAIGRILLFGGAGAAAFSGYKYFSWHKTPDFEYLSQHTQMIAALADLIIPPTDSPGAKQAGVGAYILQSVRECTTRNSQNFFIDGLKDVQQYCLSHHNKVFIECTVDQQKVALSHFEAAGKPYNGIAGKIQSRVMGDSFFTTLKRHTVEGYCTSMLGATQALAYDHVPGMYAGCIPLGPSQKAWATK